jgi:solute carrier family 25 protein 42
MGMGHGAGKGRANGDRKTKRDEKETSMMASVRRFCSGGMAGATATTATYPLDLLRARFAAHWGFDSKAYESYAEAIRVICRQEGVRGLYGGLLPTLAGTVPFAGISFCVFETLKAWTVKAQGLDSTHDLPAVQRMAMGATAGWVAQSSTYPLDVVRRRMQVHAHHRQEGLKGTLRSLYKTGGFRQGLFKGILLDWVKGPIAMGTSFTINDIVRRWMGQRRQGQGQGQG